MLYNLRPKVPINYTEVDDEPAAILDFANQNITVQCKSKKRKLSASFNDSRISNLDFKNDSSDYPIKRRRYADLDHSQGNVTTGEINIVTSTPCTTSNVKRAFFIDHDGSIDQEQQKGQVAKENLGKKYDVPGDGNCLFWSIFFAYLLPVKDDIKEFETRFRNMFPNSNDIEKVRQILCSLNLESLNTIKDNRLIREFVQKLRKKAYAGVKNRPQEIYGFFSRISRRHYKWAEEMQNAQYDVYNVIHKDFWGEDEGLNALAFLLDICIHEKQSNQKYPSKFNKYNRCTGEQILLEIKSGVTITLSLENGHYNFYYQNESSSINLRDSGLGNSLDSSVCEDISITKASSSRKRKHPLDKEYIPPKIPKIQCNNKNRVIYFDFSYDKVPVIKYKCSDNLYNILKQEVEKNSSSNISEEEYKNRLHEELAIIKQFGYSENFLIAANIAKVCQHFGIIYQLVGSANSSLVAKLLDVHTVDPIKHKLLFEVFLSHNHHPDFDFYIDSNQVHIVRDYLTKHAFPGRAGRMLKENGSVHSSSIGIKPIDSSLKIVKGKFTDCSGSIDKEGFIKFDLLSSEELHKHDQICNQESISSTGININDKNTYQLIEDGDVQYLPYVRNISKEELRKLSPKCIDDLVKLLALNRSGITTDKISVLIGKRENSLPDPLGVFSSTKGVILFEEQIMLAANKYFAVNMDKAYQFLKNLKNIGNDKKEEYIQKAVSRKILEDESRISEDESRILLNELQKKSGEIFKKSHAIACANILYKAAYFKAHYNKSFNQIYSKNLRKKKFSHKINDTSDNRTLSQDNDQELNDSVRKSCISLGVIYQIELTMSILNRLMMHQYKFSLATEEVGTGKFDDITVRYQNCQNRSKSIYIQAKHIDVEKAYNSIGSTQFFPKGRRKKCTGMFSIQKYFNSYVEKDNKNLLDAEHLIIYTNANLDKNPDNTLQYFFLKHCNIKVDKINIEEDRYKILKNIFYIENAPREQIFYKLSKESQEEIFELLKHKKKNLLNDFLDKLVLAVNQPNVRELIDSIENDMPKNANYNTLKENIYSWAAEEQGYYITHENAGEFIKEKKEKNVSQDNSRRKSYKKYRWCNALFFTTEYKFMLHMFLLYRSFILCPTNELHVMIKENRPHRLNDVYFCHAEETVYIHVNPSIEELSWEKVHNIIMKYFFNEIEKTQNSKTHFVFYIKLKDEEIEENLSIIDIEKPKHQILKNYLYVENKVKGSGFYHLSQKARKEILKSFKNNSNKECNQLLDKLVLAINQPDSRELSNMIKSKMEQLYKLDPQDYYDYNALQKALLRWLVLYNRESDISNKNWDNFIAEEISKATDQSTSSFDNRAKNAFANAIVNSTGTCNFRSLKDFLNKTEQGNDIFNSLLENKVEYHVSSILSKTGKGVVKALEKTYDTLFKTKIPGGKETYLEFLVKKNIVPHIFGMLSRAGAKAPAALEALYKMLSSTPPNGNKTYLEFFVDNKIISNISSMLHGAGAKAPAALEALYKMLSSTLPNGNKTYLEFFVNNKIISNISSMLNGAGAKAPAALEALYKVLSSTLPNGNKTYLEFFVDNKIISNISSMLCGMGAKAPAALEALYKMLSSTLPNGNKTYLEFFVDNKIISNISSMLHGARAQAPAALEALYKVLSSTLPNGNKTYLEFFVDNKIISNISGMLHGAGAQAPAALEALYKMLSSTLPNGNKTYLEFFVDNKIISNISGMLNGARAAALKALYKILSSTLPNGKETYLEFFVDNKIMPHISGMLNGAGAQAPAALEALYKMLSSTLPNGNKTYLEFFVDNKIISNISSMLSCAGAQAPAALEALYKMLSSTLPNGNKTYLEFFVDNKIISNISGMLHGAGAQAPAALEALYKMLSSTLPGGKKETYLEFFVDNKIISNISSMLHGAGAKAPAALEALYKMLSSTLPGGKKETYLEFFVDNKIISNISSMLSCAGAQAPAALEALYKMLSSTLPNGNKTYLEFFVDNKIISNISGMLHGAGAQAPAALEALYKMLSSTLPNGNKTYLEFFVDNKIISNISSMLNGAGAQAPAALEALYKMLSSTLPGGKKETYLEFFVDNKIISNISSMLSGTGAQAPAALEALYKMLSSTLPGGKKETYLEFFVDNKIISNISSMLSCAGAQAPAALEALYKMLSSTLPGGKKETYLEFLVKKNIMPHISSMLCGTGAQAPAALEALYKMLSSTLPGGKKETYLEFFVDNKIISNISSMLSCAGAQAPAALEALYKMLSSTLPGGKKETYLEFFVDNKIISNISSMLHGAGAKAPAALEALYKMLSSTLPGGKKETYLEFLVKKNIMPHISSMLCGTGAQAPAALEALYKMLSSTLPNGNKTYLEFFVDNKIMSNISGMLNGVGAQAPAALKALYKMLSSTLPGGKETYLEFFVDNKIMSNISSMLNSVRAKAPVVLEALYKVLSSTLPNGNKTYLEFFVNNKIISNISSMLNGAGAQAPAALEALYKVLSSTLPNGNKTYLEFFVNNKIMSNISSMLHGAGAQAPAALEALYKVLSSTLPNGNKTYLEFFVNNKIMSNISNMLHDAGAKAPTALKELCDTLFSPLVKGKKVNIAKHLEENIGQLFKTLSSNGVKYKVVSNTLKMIHDRLFEFNPNRKEWEKIDDLETLYADLDNIFKNHKKRIKIINGIKCIFNDNKDIGGVICQKANGMDLKSIEYNIQLMVKTGLKINSILDTVSIKKVLCHNNQYSSILLVNGTSSNHSVVLLKRNNTISIIDPLSAKSEFSSSLEEIRKDLMTLGVKSVNIIYSDLQQDNYAICADISLILIKNIENKLLDIRSDKDIVKIIENIKAEMYNTLPDLGQKIVSLVSEEKLQDTCGYVPKYGEHKKVWGNPMQLIGKRLIHDV